MNCLDVDDNSQGNFEMFPIPEGYKGSAIKYQLNFISFSQGDVFSFKFKNDSITVVEKEVSPISKHVFTFDTKTKTLLQMANFSQTTERSTVSFTNFVSYQTINGIVVPKTITYTNNFIIASIEYQTIEFKGKSSK